MLPLKPLVGNVLREDKSRSAGGVVSIILCTGVSPFAGKPCLRLKVEPPLIASHHLDCLTAYGLCPIIWASFNCRAVESRLSWKLLFPAPDCSPFCSEREAAEWSSRRGSVSLMIIRGHYSIRGECAGSRRPVYDDCTIFSPVKLSELTGHGHGRSEKGTPAYRCVSFVTCGDKAFGSP